MRKIIDIYIPDDKICSIGGHDSFVTFRTTMGDLISLDYRTLERGIAVMETDEKLREAYKPCPECGEKCGHKVNCYEGMKRRNKEKLEV